MDARWCERSQLQALQQPGNCIPLALWHLLEAKRDLILENATRADSPANVQAETRGVRDYHQARIHALWASRTCLLQLPRWQCR
jgi:hypothetical protein